MEIHLHHLDSVNWPELIRIICMRLVLNQRELADRCKVSAQAVSAWHCARRSPDTHARRMLLALVREAGIEVLESDTTTGGDASVAEQRGEWALDTGERGLAELARLYRGMSPARRRDLLEYARFKAQRREGKKA